MATKESGAAAGAAAIGIERVGQAVVARPQIKLMGDEELKTLGRLVDEATGADSGVTLVVLDLSKVTILPSLALGVLVQINNKCRARDQRLKLAGVQPQVRQVLAVTRLDRLFQFAESVEAAMA